MLFSMAIPVVFMGVVFVGVTALVVWEWHDPVVAALSALGAIVTIVRLLVIHSYRRREISAGEIRDVRRWERGYAGGNYAFALLLGLYQRAAAMKRAEDISTAVGRAQALIAGAEDEARFRARR